MVNIFDTHWHGRDEEEAHKETLEHSLAVAEASGIDAIVAKPNTKRPLDSLERCESYLSLADQAKSPVHFYVNISITKNPEQIKRAIDAMRKNNRIVAPKIYFGPSTNPETSLNSEDDTILVWKTIAQEGYKGPVECHFEYKPGMRDHLYKKDQSWMWSTHCRPTHVEIASFFTNVGIAASAGFEGKMHACHISTLEVLSYVISHAQDPSLPFRLSGEVTPHHLFLNHSYLFGPTGFQYKCNPPLRDEPTRVLMESIVLSHRTQGISIASDHAPHRKHEEEKPSSGIACGSSWRYVIRTLEHKGIAQSHIRKLVFDNPAALYGLKLEPSGRKPNIKRLKQLQAFYPFDPFEHFKEKYV